MPMCPTSWGFTAGASRWEMAEMKGTEEEEEEEREDREKGFTEGESDHSQGPTRPLDIQDNNTETGEAGNRHDDGDSGFA